MQRVERFHQIVIPQDSYHTPADEDKFGMRNLKLPAIGEVQDERPETAAHPKLDLLRIHVALLSLKRAIRKAGAGSYLVFKADSRWLRISSSVS